VLGKAGKKLRSLYVLNSAGTVSGKKEALFLTLVPASTFALVLVATWVSGVAHQPGCNSVSNFLANLAFRSAQPSTCRAVPFLSDVPTLILSFGCPFAFVSYRLLRRRLASLYQALGSTGLLRGPEESKEKISRGIARLEREVDLTPFTRFALFCVSVGMVTWLYLRNLSDGDLFNTLASTAEDGTTNADQLRATWWANYESHPFLAALCVLIGSVGVTYAIRAGWLYLRLGGVLFVTRKAPPDTLPVRYVPRWVDRSYGWSPVTGVLMLIYFSTVNFAMSMVAVFDMLRNETWTLAVAVFFALIGIASTVTIVLTSFFRMVAAHRAVEERLRGEMLARGAGGSSGMTSEEYVVAAAELAAWRRIPVASFVGTAIKVLPGFYALFQFGRVLSG
jgi:hypothetical protein